MLKKLFTLAVTCTEGSNSAHWDATWIRGAMLGSLAGGGRGGAVGKVRQEGVAGRVWRGGCGGRVWRVAQAGVVLLLAAWLVR